MKYHKYNKVVREFPWIETVVITLARRYDMLGENETPSRDFIRHQIEHLALHSVHDIEWDKPGGSDQNGVWTIQTWIPFSSISTEERCSLPIGDVYTSDTAQRVVNRQRFMRGGLRISIDCMAWVTYTLGAKQSNLRLDLYQTAIYLENQN